MEKTLFVSDLDGTLLLPDKRLSDYTVSTLNRLTAENGLLFSYATARSLVTASIVTKGLSSQIPAIIYNGVFITHKGKTLLSNFFTDGDVRLIKNLAGEKGVSPIVYSFNNGKERFSYIPDLNTSAQNEFAATRNDFRKTPVNTAEELYSGDVFYFTFIGENRALDEIYAALKDRFVCYMQKDIYSGEIWLEITPPGATKANAALKLKKMLDCNKLVVFGDGINDASMFEAADECYAVENADPKLKQLATAVIASNSQNAVAEFICNIYYY